ncbi:Unconventional myosin-XV, partial [Clonorchis sinensis]
GTKATYTTHSDLDGLSILLDAWHTLGLPREEINLCLRVISAILHLGNLKFKESYDGDKCTVINPKVAEIAASELGVDPQQLTKVITMKLTQTMRESLWSPVRESQARVNRDSIAKQIYSELFDRLVAMLNDRLSPPDMSEIHTTKGGVHTIALLDIYGFENLPYNSLEQLCINYTNENLQKFFNHYIFELEQQEYVSEGIDWQFIAFPDNQPIINLIAGRPNGIFHVCNDEASLAAGTDRSFLQRCQREHRDHPNFSVPKLNSDDSFAVVHFAGEITYKVAGFVDKNREQMRSEVLNLLIESTEPVVASMFQNVYSRRSNLAVPGPRLKTPMVLATFNTSLQNLMEKMKKCQPQFVRCIKPNMEKKPMTLEESIVFDQLRYTGVLEATRIRKSGFPVRPNYNAFIQNYGFLLPKTEHQYLRKLNNPMEAARYLLNRLNLGIGINGAPTKGIDFELGRTKLFMRNQLAANLDAVVSLVQARSARIIQNAWRRRGDGLYERARENACKVIQSYYRGYRARRQNPALFNYVSNRVEDLETKEPPKPLNDLEIARLDLPGDLVYILEERGDDQSRWLQRHRVSKPRASVRRLLQGQQADGWQSYGRPVWDAQPLSFLLRGGKSKTNIGYTLAPLQRPLLLAHATEPQRAACVAASKLLLRLVHLPEQPIMEQYLTGSYLYQLALTHRSLHKEILTQMLSQSINWPYDWGTLQDSDKEDEVCLFENSENRHPGTYSIVDGTLNAMISDTSHIYVNDLKRRAYRRLWMHIAGILTCGRLSSTLKPIIVRFLRQHGPPRSVPLCEDRLVLAPSVSRLYPPCLLEWRVNYTGTNMGISLTFPDGLVSIIHVGSFTKAETLAGVAMALRTRSVHALPGWTVSFYTPDYLLDIPGHSYVMDVFSSFELPSDWCNLNYILPDHVFPTFPTNTASKVKNKLLTDETDSSPFQESWRPPSSNGFPRGIPSVNLDPATLSTTIHGLENTPSLEGHTTSSIRSATPHSVSSWNKAVRNMALKRFNSVSRSASCLRRASSRKERQWRTEGGSLPRSRSPEEIAASGRIARDPVESGPTPDFGSTRKPSSAVPHGMRYFTYEHDDWIIRVRKEFITPCERIRTTIVLNMVFAQIITDLFNPINRRLRQHERKVVMEMIGKRGCSSVVEYVNQTPLEIKKNVVIASLNFPLYFGRFFPVVVLGGPISATQCHWLVLSHHGVRLVYQRSDSRDFDIQASVTLGEIKKVETSRMATMLGWRMGDTTQDEKTAGLAIHLKFPSQRETSLRNLSNLLILASTEKEYRIYTDMAEKISELIKSFVKEYEEEMKRLKEAAEKRELRTALGGRTSSLLSDGGLTRSTPEVGFRYACSPPLLTAAFGHRESPTPTPASPQSPLKCNPPFPHKPPMAPTRQTANSTPDRKLRQLNVGRRRKSLTVSSESATPDSRKRVQSVPAAKSLSGTTTSSRLTPPIRHAPEPSNKEHPLIPFAEENFANKSDLLDQLSWQPTTESFQPMLPHQNASDFVEAKKIFSYILQFCGEERSTSPSYRIFRSLVELVSKHPGLSNEAYCQLVKQTYRNSSNLPNGQASPWLLWALVSIFVPTSDTIRPHLVSYVNSAPRWDNLLVNAAQETLSRSMTLVAKLGPRKKLPPDNVLSALTSGALFHQQEVNLPNDAGLLATVGQLSLVRDVIRGLVEQFDFQTANYARDFALFIAPKVSSGKMNEGYLLIPLNYDEYLLDSPVYYEDFGLFFRRISWTVPVDYRRLPQPMLIYLFEQVAEDYLCGHWISGELISNPNESVEECARISALLYHGRGGSQSVQRVEALSLRPERLHVTDEQWLRRVKHFLLQEAKNSPLDAQAAFLQALEKWPLFGATVFSAESKCLLTSSPNKKDGSSRVWVAVTRFGVQFLDHHTRQSISSYRFEEVASTRVNYMVEHAECTEGIVTLTTTKGINLVLQLKQAKMFVFVLNQYQRMLSADLIASE